MQFRKILCSSSFALDSAHEKSSRFEQGLSIYVLDIWVGEPESGVYLKLYRWL